MLLKMDYDQLKKDLEGLYITIPTLFHDEDLPTFNKDNIPENLKNIPAIKPGSRNIS